MKRVCVIDIGDLPYGCRAGVGRASEIGNIFKLPYGLNWNDNLGEIENIIRNNLGSYEINQIPSSIETDALNFVCPIKDNKLYMPGFSKIFQSPILVAG